MGIFHLFISAVRLNFSLADESPPLRGRRFAVRRDGWGNAAVRICNSARKFTNNTAPLQSKKDFCQLPQRGSQGASRQTAISGSVTNRTWCSAQRIKNNHDCLGQSYLNERPAALRFHTRCVTHCQRRLAADNAELSDKLLNSLSPAFYSFKNPE